MPVVAFTAGSLGDILALIDLARRLFSSVSELSNLSGELKDLMEDISTFTRAVEGIKTVIQRRQVESQPDVQQVEGALDVVSLRVQDDLLAAATGSQTGHSDVLLAFRTQVGTCATILDAINKRIEAFIAKRVGPGGLAKKTLRKCLAAAVWEVFGGRNEVEKLRARLHNQIVILQLYLALFDSQDRGAVLDSIRSQHVAINKILVVEQEIARRVGEHVAPSHRFTDQKTGLPYYPFARSAVERIMHLFGTITIHDRAGHSLGTPSTGYGHQTLNSCVTGDHLLGIAGGAAFRTPAWDSSVQCYFYRGDYGYFEVLIAIAPVQARYNTSAIPALCRDIIGVGHATDPGSYLEIKDRGDYVNRVWDVYQELCIRCSTSLVGSNQEELVELLNNFPDPELMETTVLPRVRQLYDGDLELANSSDTNAASNEILRRIFQFHPPSDIQEVLCLVRSCPRLDSATVARHELSKNIKASPNPPLMWGISIECTDIAATLVRAASRLPNFWRDL